MGLYIIHKPKICASHSLCFSTQAGKLQCQSTNIGQTLFGKGKATNTPRKYLERSIRQVSHLTTREIFNSQYSNQWDTVLEDPDRNACSC